MPGESRVRTLARRSALLRRIHRYPRRHRIETFERLRAFVPYSAGTLEQLSSLALCAAEQTPQLLSELASQTGAPRARHLTTTEFWRTFGQPDTSELESLLRYYGSDKPTRHDYHLVYAPIFADIGSVTCLLEIGLGSNNEDVPSNMGKTGRPGASLRAFRDYLPGCNVYGADVDERILFSEDRIVTSRVDQTDKVSMRALAARLPEGLDLVIDDGLHSPNANLAVLLLGLEKVRQGGWIVIEDVSLDAAPIWEAVAGLIGGAHTCFTVRSMSTLLFCVRRGNSDAGTGDLQWDGWR